MEHAWFNHHLFPKYLFTPIAITYFMLDSGIKIKCVYIFGIRIIRIGL